MKGSTVFWALTILTAALGVASGFVGCYLEVAQGMEIGLYFMMGCAVFMGMAGIFASVATKYQSEGK